MSISKKLKHWFDEAPHFEGTIIASERIGSRIQKVTIALPEPVDYPFPIGCYVQPMTWGCVPRAYSVALADRNSFTLLVSFSGGGCGSRFFRDSKVGDKVVCYGPYDDFPYRYRTGRSKVFFATSTGVAPFRRMIDEAIGEGVDVALYLGSPKEGDVAFKAELEELSRAHPSFTFCPTLSNPDPDWTGAHGYVTDHIVNNPDLMRKSDIYICGIPIMTMGVLEALEKVHVPEKQIFVQKFG